MSLFIKTKSSISSKRKILIEEDIYEERKIKLKQLSKDKIDLPVLKIINYRSSWINFANLLVKQVKKNILYETHRAMVEKSKKYKTKYYQIVYKLINSPIMYQISIKETKLLCHGN